MTYIFQDVDNPHPETLATVNPDLPIPAGYAGLNRDPWLAEVFNQLVVDGDAPDVLALADRASDNAYQGERLADLDGFLTVAKRFNVSQPEFLYYNFAHVLDMAEHSNWYYVIFLAVHYRQRVINLATTLMQLINTEESDRKQIPVRHIDTFIETNTFLRQEGVILPLQELYAFSKQWTKEDAYKLLSNKIHLEEANTFAKAGFTDATTIVRSKRFILPSMLDDLINPKPLLPTDDDDDGGF